MGQAGNVYSVSQVNSYIKNMFSQDFMLRRIQVKGELSNVKYHTSGHIYFTLKDGKSAVRAVMFAGNRTGLKCRLTEGLSVIVTGSIDVYERDGNYQLYAKEITKDGIGVLYERFLAMKKEMEEMGMFADTYKQPIPQYIHTLGVVTAPTGAAVRDIINIARRRNPYVQIILYPALVQGEGAIQSIVRGILALEKQAVDVIIVGRGGGSMEDLWAFNEWEVAQAIFDCTVPVISAVGHETDVTIADYVADLRAPTPSAAAELAVSQISLTEERLAEYRNKMMLAVRRKCQTARFLYEQKKAELSVLSPLSQIREKRMRKVLLEEAYENVMQKKLQDTRHRMAILLERYKGLSPLEKLSKGYSYIEMEDGKCLKDASQVKEGDVLLLHLYKGMVEAVVSKTDTNEMMD